MVYVYCLLFFCLGFLFKMLVDSNPKGRKEPLPVDMTGVALEAMSARIKILENRPNPKINNAEVMDTFVYLESQIKECRENHSSLEKHVASLSPVHRHYYKYTPKTKSKEINQ